MQQLARGSLQVKNLLLFLGSNRWKNKDSSYLECTAKHRQALLQTEPDLCQASCNQAGKVPKILNPLTKPTGIREEKFDSWFPFSPSFLSEEREIRKYASKCGLGIISLNYGSFLCMCAQSLQSCLTLCDHMDCSPPGSSVHGILQARILEWVVMPSSRGSSWPTGGTWVSCRYYIAGRFFTTEPLRKPRVLNDVYLNRWWRFSKVSSAVDFKT